jgi:fatty acid CoA ligase FadD28
MITYENVLANFQQWVRAYFADSGMDMTVVSWLPFYHDMGLMAGIFKPVLGGVHAVLMSPVAFLQRPARWMQLMATHRRAATAGPNFAYELAVRKTTDEDMAGLDLGDVLAFISGSERIHAATLRRFSERFAKFNLDRTVLRPSYGLAEAVLYVATSASGQPPPIVRFDPDALSAGRAEPCATGGTPLVGYELPPSPMVRIVDPEATTECPDGITGEIWVHGHNVASGYWGKTEETQQTFRAKLVNPSTGTPEEPWLRTGDLGFVSDGELFVMGRIKDLLIVYGRNHSPDDIEATIQEITRGRCVAIAVPDKETEKLVAIIEFKKNGDSAEVAAEKLVAVKRKVASAISNSHGLGVADLVVVAPGSIPITTSGKVRRAACVEQYRQNQFARLDA